MSNPVIIKRMAVRNFKLFRKEVLFDLAAGTYLIGPNNSGKTSVLNAVRYFFDDSLYESRDFLNRSEFTSRQTGANAADITLYFDLSVIRKPRLRESLTKKYGDELQITKRVKQTKDIRALVYTYMINRGEEQSRVSLEPEINELLQSIKVNYLHPQKGESLLAEAQSKLKKRLLENFGRNSSGVTQEIRELENKWKAFNGTATKYLSTSLQGYVQRVWPGSEVAVSLPKDIKDILAISNISFTGYKGAPSVDLLNQGAGAQSLILYLTHYMLDIDRTPYRNTEYHPLWLVEEPETFLHSDLIAKLGAELNSEQWTSNIPLIVSTHSSVLLSRSTSINDRAVWHVLSAGEPPKSRASTAWSPEEVDDIGKLMGDVNFRYYFEGSRTNVSLYAEDQRESTLAAYERSGLDISKSLQGITKFKNMVDTLVSLDENLLTTKKIALVDNDRGFDTIKHLLESNALATIEDFRLIPITKLRNAYIILFPSGFAAEDLFKECEAEVEKVVNSLFDPDMKLNYNVPTNLTDLASYFRKTVPVSREAAKEFIKRHSEFKNIFWHSVDKHGWNLDENYSKAIQKLSAVAQSNLKA